MSKPHPPSPYFTRRHWLMALGAAASWPLVAPLLGCGVASINAAGDTSAAPSSPSAPAAAATATPAPAATTPASPAADGIDPTKWATGGAQTLAASYADPIGSTDGSVCALTCQTAEGTCASTSGTTLERADISEGQNGLPMMVVLRLLDPSCQPLVGASVNLWHTSPQGLYSGPTQNPAYCCNNNSAAQAAAYFRGMQRTDATGEVIFRSCFPGWTSGRTVHVNLEIDIKNKTFLTTQLLFTDTTTDGIIASQALYSSRGPRDTNNQNDPTVAASQASAYTLGTAQMPDGCMLAYKTVVLRDSLGDPLCTVPISDAAAASAANGNTLLQ